MYLWLIFVQVDLYFIDILEFEILKSSLVFIVSYLLLKSIIFFICDFANFTISLWPRSVEMLVNKTWKIYFWDLLVSVFGLRLDHKINIHSHLIIVSYAHACAAANGSQIAI